jgi:hypothetical protein
MKKLKLKLDELKVQSFVTELNPGLSQTAKGGEDDTGYGTDIIGCPDPQTITLCGASAASSWPCRLSCGTGPTGTKPISRQPPGGGNPGSTPGA